MALVVQGCGAPEVWGWLLSYGEPATEVEKAVRGAQQSDPVSSGILTLETKYYKARVKSRVLQGTCTDRTYSEVITKGTDAFIQVLTAEEEGVSPDIEVKVSTDTKVAEESDVGTRVLVKIGSSEEDTGAMRWVTWSLDHGFEYIYVDRTNLMNTADEREKEGLPRLIECLQSTTWQTMESKDASSSSSKQNVFRFQEESTTAATTSDDASTTASVFTRDGGDDINPFLEKEVIPAENEEERKAQSFENLMEQAMKLRDDVHAGSLSDEARREKAAQFAMQFASVLDLGDDSDDSDV